MKKHVLAAFVLLSVLFVTVSIGMDTEAAAPAGRWKNVRNIWWFQYDSGNYAVNEYIDGYWLDRNGVYIPGWEGSWCSDNTGWWFQSGSWYPTNTWLKIDGIWYYFKGDGYMASKEWIGDYYMLEDGSMATSQWVDDKYYVDETGKWDPDKTKPGSPENDKTNGTVPDDMKKAIAYSKDIYGVMHLNKFLTYFEFQGTQGGYVKSSTYGLMSIDEITYEEPKIIEIGLGNKYYKVSCKTEGDYNFGDYYLVKEDLLNIYYFIHEQKVDGFEVQNNPHKVTT